MDEEETEEADRLVLDLDLEVILGDREDLTTQGLEEETEDQECHSLRSMDLQETLSTESSSTISVQESHGR